MVAIKSAAIFRAWSLNLLAWLTFPPERGGNTFIRNVAKILPDYTALRPKRQHFIISRGIKVGPIQKTTI